MDTGSGPAILLYLDLDNFKPFNDHSGFRQGDRVIIMLAELITLRTKQYDPEIFVGHVGGDDFFVGFQYKTENELNSFRSMVYSFVQEFQEDALTFYTPEEKKQRYIVARDRSGRIARVGLLRASAGILVLPDGLSGYTEETLFQEIALVKHESKADSYGYFEKFLKCSLPKNLNHSSEEDYCRSESRAGGSSSFSP